MKQVKQMPSEDPTVTPVSEPVSEISQQTQEQPAKPGKDYLAPALVFIALFFAFFILITIQRLTKGYVHKEQEQIPSAGSVVIINGEKNEAQEQIQKDNTKDAEDVTDELLEEIDDVGDMDVDEVLGDTNLDEFSELEE